MADQSSILPQRIDGERIVLREWRPEDEPALSAALARNAEHLRPWMPWMADEPLPAERRVALITEWQQSRLLGGDAIFGIFLEQAIVGGCGLHRRRGPNGLEIGYWIDRKHTGRGLAREAARLLTTTALGHPGVMFVEIHHDKANFASRRIPERLGYQLMGETATEEPTGSEIGIDCAWRVDASAWARR